MFKKSPKLNKTLPQLFLTFFLLLLSGIISAQTDLVRWNNANFTPTIVASNVSASNITVQNVSLSHQNWGNADNLFQTGGWPSGGINTSKYIEFSISPTAGFKVDLDQFNFYYRTQGTPQNFQVRYSKDDFSTFYTSIADTGVGGNWSGASANIASANPIMPGQTLKIRIYVYNTYNNFLIKRVLNINSPNNHNHTPTITGTVSPAVTGDPTDLKVTKTMDISEPQPGSNVTYTILVENLGSNTASGASVIDNLPAGFSYVSSNASSGTYNFGTGSWTIGDLSGGANANLQIVAQMQATGPYTNTATVSHYGNDPVTSNNSSSVTPTNVCGNCSYSIPNGGGHFDVAPGETYCLHSGTYTGSFTLASGGTICIASGANFNPAAPSVFHGTIINRGNMNLQTYNNSNHTATIVNLGSFTSSGFQNFAGALQNYGTTNITGYNQFLSGAQIFNEGTLNLSNSHFTNTTVNNYGNLSVNNGLNVDGGYWENHLDGEILVNMTTTGSNMNFNADFDNSGLWRFARISVLNGLINNYGHLQVYNSVSDISQNTYLTNDGLIEFIDIANIEFNGPMLTNNGDIILTHASTGNFKMNQDINEVHNNGLIQVSGDFEQNAEGSSLVNNCRIVARDFMAREGNTTNNGIINALQNVEIHGDSNFRNNTITSRIQGVNFDNDGVIRGFGSFYFTGNTDNSGGQILGDDASNPINFYDATPTTSSMFDSEGGSTTDNVIRPESMEVVDFNSYICTAPPTSAGYPPTTEDLNFDSSTPGVVTIPLYNHAFPHANVNGQPFTLMYNSMRLFEHGNAHNPTNNTTSLVIPGKGTFTVNTSNGEITFTPEPTFLEGTATADYKISNSWSGTPPVHPGSRRQITVTFNNISCFKDPNLDPADSFSSTGVSTLGTPAKGWPETIPNGLLALESKDKGFVITRVANEEAIAEPKEGMLIYDIGARCVKLYNGTLWNCIQKRCN